MLGTEPGTLYSTTKGNVSPQISTFFFSIKFTITVAFPSHKPGGPAVDKCPSASLTLHGEPSLECDSSGPSSNQDGMLQSLERKYMSTLDVSHTFHVAK